MINKKIFLSVVIPAYNEEVVIGKCLKSVINQTLPADRYEVIVIDNNSADQTAKIAAELGAKVVREPNQGLVYARMRSFQEAKAEIVASLDADTTVSPDWLKKILTIYENNPSVVGIGLLSDFTPSNLLVSLSVAPAALIQRLFKILPGYNFSLKKSAYFHCGGYDPKIDFNEDFCITKKIKKEGKVVVVYEKGLVTTSSRRFKNLQTFIPYSLKLIVSFFTVFLFNVSFFKLKPVKKKT